MSKSEMFKEFIGNLAIKNTENISLRYGEITSALNKEFRDTESKTAYTLQVGSFGRRTGIKGISDLDMLYIMPKGKWDYYKDGKQLKLLQDTKAAIKARYPNTKINVDRLVVTVKYLNFHVEVQPVFEQEDGSFKYPDTKGDGSWKITKPKEEMSAISELDSEKNYNLKKLCKMARAWRNQHGLGIGGLLIDTLVYNFFKSTTDYDSNSYYYYDVLSRDFFKFLSELPKQNRYSAPGSNQHVKVKKAFQKKAKKAYDLCLKAIEAEGTERVNDKWKKVYGRNFPSGKENITENIYKSYDNTEQFIEFKHAVDIKYNLTIDCNIKQNGFRENTLLAMIANRIPLLAKKSLEFKVIYHDIPGTFDIKWKVLNRGDEARRRNNIRGQIVHDSGNMTKNETTEFKGDHIVECYAIKDDVVVAKDRIHVPISTSS